MNLKDILCGTETYEIKGETGQEITGLSLDSRKIYEGYLFAAIRGEKSDGHQFIENAVNDGAVAVLCERIPQNTKGGVTYIKVDDASFALAKIASNFYNNPSSDLYLAGVTGTNGKTTLTYLLESVWRKQNRTPGLIGTIENRYAGISDSSIMTTPDSIELSKLLYRMKNAGVDNVCMEVSSHSIERKRVHGCHFDCAVFTNISQDHLDYHGTFENYFNSKKKFFTEILEKSEKSSKVAVINMDDSYGRNIASETTVDKLTYSVVSSKADIYATDVRFLEDRILANIHTPWGNFDLESFLIGRHNLYNLLAAISVSANQTGDIALVRESFSGRLVIPGRLEKVENESGLNVFVDYAHTPDALENILETVRPLTNGKLITVFGCGGDRDRGKRPKMGKIGYEMSDIAIITSDNPRTESPLEIIRDIEQGIEKTTDKNYLVIQNREEAIREAIKIAGSDDFVVIAGKGHEDYQIIGEKKLHFDDRETARRYIKEKEKDRV